jgi:predicted  nucleic acid-binding Zn-ribbon protein
MKIIKKLKMENQFEKNDYKKLEDQIFHLSTLLQNEIENRKNDNETFFQITHNFNNELENLKQTFQRYDIEIDKTFRNLKNSLENDVSKKNNAMIDYLKTHIDDIKKNKKEINEKSNNDNYTNDNIELYRIQPNLKFDKKVQKEFIQYRTELNSLAQKIDNIENKFDIKINEINNKLEKLELDISYVKNNFDDFQSQKNTTDKKIFDLNQIVNEEFQKINQILNNYIASSLTDHLNKIELISNETDDKFNSVNKKFSEIECNINCVNQDLNKKIMLLKESLITQLNNQNKEIENFETHQMNEYDIFNSSIRGVINDHINQLKSIYEYTNKDIDLLRNKHEYLVNSINKLRQDVFESIKESDNFLLNKIEISSRSNQQK